MHTEPDFKKHPARPRLSGSARQLRLLRTMELGWLAKP